MELLYGDCGLVTLRNKSPHANSHCRFAFHHFRDLLANDVCGQNGSTAACAGFIEA
jgi:hypothetical protein